MVKGLLQKQSLRTNPMRRGEEVIYQAPEKNKNQSTVYRRLFRGTLEILNALMRSSLLCIQSIYDNTPYIKEKELISEGMDGNPVPQKIGDPSPINTYSTSLRKTVLRSVLGDIPEGNGDPLFASW